MDVLALLEAKGITWVPKGGDEISVTCPNESQHSQGTDSLPSFNINTAKLKCHCFVCNLRMSEVGLTKWLMGNEIDSTQLRSLRLRGSMKRLRSENQLMLVDTEQDTAMLPPGEPWEGEYRGISEEVYRKVNAIKCTRGRYVNRLVVEVRMSGKLIGLDARALGNEQPKYLRPYNSKAKSWLFPFDLCQEIIKETRGKFAIISEGIFHSLNACQFYFPSVCYFGINNFSSENVLQLLDLGVNEIIIFPDRDKAGEGAVETIGKMLIDLFEVSVASIEYLTEIPSDSGKIVYKDLGDLTKEEIQKSIDDRVKFK